MDSQTAAGPTSQNSFLWSALQHLVLPFPTLQHSLVLIHYQDGLLGWLLMYTHTKYISQKTNMSVQEPLF